MVIMLPRYYDNDSLPLSRIRSRQNVNPAFTVKSLVGVDEVSDRNNTYDNFNEYRLQLLDDQGKTHRFILAYRNPLQQAMLPNMVANNDTQELQPIRPQNKLGAFGQDLYASQYYRPTKRDHKGPMENETVCFQDGVRQIDYVLAYKRTSSSEDKKVDKRDTFEENLEQVGLDLELEDKQYSQDGETYFLKIHAPWDVLARYAELMNMKMPIKELEDEEVKKSKPLCGCNIAALDYNKKLIPDELQYFTSTFSRSRENQFVIKDKNKFFSNAQRSRIVWEILMHTSYASEAGKVGIIRLLNNGTYDAAFPIHDPQEDLTAPSNSWDKQNLLQNQGRFPSQQTLHRANTRTLLYMEWAKPRNWYKKQPLQLIRKYFGDKIGIYFAWLGFYTSMLIPAAIVGLVCFLYGIFTLPGSLPATDICDESGVGNITICPLCDISCPYKKLSDSCDFSKVTYLFDNPATVFFSVFMSFWATMFLEFWKRYQARIVWEWDLAHLEDEEERLPSLADEDTDANCMEPPRPEFEASVRTHKKNPVTKENEPFLPLWNRSLRILAASSLVFFMLAVVIMAVFGVIVYRIALQTVLFSSSDEVIKENAKITVAVTSAMLNLAIILILDKVYQKIAVFLTDMERPRTQTEYENSFTFKMFLFQSINFYSSLIYIAFFKGSLMVGHPLKRSMIQAEQCDPAGCLFELCVQLAIIMVGKQIMNNITEIMFPKVLNWWRTRKSQSNTKQLYTRWEKDYDLEPLDHLTLFNEYLEMVIQFGFVTIFVAAFPLAPLFALLNNIVEIRLDAYKFVTQIRRPMAARANDIGAWLQILKSISIMAVIVNSFVIAYTSGFVPRMVYMYQYSHNFTLVGYIENTLSKFNTSDYIRNKTGPSDEIIKREPPPEFCWYRDYRNPADGKDPYKRSLQYWHVFAARLAFVVVFEHLVFVLTGLMAYLIPDVPSDVKKNIRREKLLAREAIYAAELERLTMERQQLNIHHPLRRRHSQRNRAQTAPLQNLDDILNDTSTAETSQISTSLMY